jgi:hypothetical protein
VSVCSLAQTSRPNAKLPAAANASGSHAEIESNSSLSDAISFRFDILNLVTNHQFPGQKNSFHVEYEYEGDLGGSGFDPTGHTVAADRFPYFQSVRNDIIDFATRYKNRDDFYEVYGDNICHFIMGKYPQIRKMTVSIDIPAYKGVAIARGETVIVTRNTGDNSR